MFAPITFLCLGNECLWWQWIVRTIDYLFLIYCVDYRKVPWIPFAFLFGGEGWLESCHFWVVYLKPGDVAIRSNINLLKSQACKFGIFAEKLPMKEERTRKRRSSSRRIRHRSLPHILFCGFNSKHLHTIDKRCIQQCSSINTAPESVPKSRDKGNHAPWLVWISDEKLLVFASLISPSKSVCLRSYVNHSSQFFITI